MLRFRARGERASSPPVFDAAPLDIRDASFAAIAAANGLSLAPAFSGSATSPHRVRDIYLNDPELQKLYPLGLLPLGQLHFLGWLTRHGRADQRLTDAEIHAFLRESAADEPCALRLTYLLQPGWQEHFPCALTAEGWNEFRDWIQATYGAHLSQPLPSEVPPIFLSEVSRELKRGAPLEGVNILSHFCNPSGIQQAALWAKVALERGGIAHILPRCPGPAARRSE